MFDETLTAVLDMFSDIDIPVYLSNPDPVVLHPGDPRLIPGVEPADPKQTRIVIQRLGEDFDPQRSCNAELEYDLSETDSSALSIPWPQPWIMRLQVEFKGAIERDVNRYKSDLLQQFHGSDSTDISVSWLVSGETITRDDCAVKMAGIRDMTTTYNNQRRIRHVLTLEIETWLWSDEEPFAVPLIQQRILRRGFDLGGDDTRYIKNLEE